MRKLVVSEFVSLDGVIEHPAWTRPFERTEGLAATLRLVEAKPLGAGVVVRTYQPITNEAASGPH